MGPDDRFFRWQRGAPVGQLSIGGECRLYRRSSLVSGWQDDRTDVVGGRGRSASRIESGFRSGWHFAEFVYAGARFGAGSAGVAAGWQWIAARDSRGYSRRARTNLV